MFKFKQFSIRDTNSAMKVGTDGTLLGCWTDFQNANTVLDIGSGAGTIAIIAAQKNAKAVITGVEIDEGAIIDAEYNKSLLDPTWQSRINFLNNSLQSYTSKDKFDVIVSNPPFFENSQLNEDKSKQRARHTSSLHYSEIFEFAKHHLTAEGGLNLVLPYSNGMEAMNQAVEYGLYLHRKCEVKPVPHKPPHRLLLTFGLIPKPLEESNLTIETGVNRHEYTAEYQKIGKEFYLYF